jgi:AraC-like DNA-binding protein
VVESLWAAAFKAERDPTLPLAVAQRLRIGAFGTLGRLIETSPSVGVAFDRVMRYLALWSDAGRFTSKVQRTCVDVVYRETNRRPDVRLSAVCVLAEVVTVARELVGPDVAVLQASIPIVCPPAARIAFEQIFGACVVADATEASLRFSRDWWEAPMSRHDRFAALFLEGAAAQSLLSGLPLPEIARAVLQELPAGVSIAGVAGRLALSERTLRRRLAQAGTTFEDVVRSSRIALAVELLRDPHTALVDVAFQLGYSEQSAFQRAFKGWFDLSPGALRASLHQRSPSEALPLGKGSP